MYVFPLVAECGLEMDTDGACLDECELQRWCVLKYLPVPNMLLSAICSLLTPELQAGSCLQWGGSLAFLLSSSSRQLVPLENSSVREQWWWLSQAKLPNSPWVRPALNIWNIPSDVMLNNTLASLCQLSWVCLSPPRSCSAPLACPSLLTLI